MKLNVLAGFAAGCALVLAPAVHAAPPGSGRSSSDSEAPAGWTAERLVPVPWRSAPIARSPIGAAGCSRLASSIREETGPSVPAALRAALEPLIARAGRHPAEGSLLVALLAVAADRPEPAAWAAARIALLAPDDPLAAANLGVLAALVGREGPASDLLAHAAARAPEARGLAASLGWAELGVGDLDAAERAFAEAARAFPADVAAWQGLAVIAAARRGWDGAREPVRRARALADTPATRALASAIAAAPAASPGDEPEPSLAEVRARLTGDRLPAVARVDLAAPEVSLVPGVFAALAPAIEADVAARTAELRSDAAALAALGRTVAAAEPERRTGGERDRRLARREGRPIVHLDEAVARLRADAGPALAALAGRVGREVSAAQQVRGALLERARDARDRCAGEVICSAAAVAAHCREWDARGGDTHRILRALHEEVAARASQAAERFALESAAPLRDLGPGPARARAEAARRVALEEVALGLRAPLVPWAAFAAGTTPLCPRRSAAPPVELVELAIAAPVLPEAPPGRCALDGAAFEIGPARLVLSCDGLEIEGGDELVAELTELATLRGPERRAELGVACAATAEAAFGAGPALAPGVVLTLADGAVVDVAPLGPAAPAGEPVRAGACALRLGPGAAR